jgi:hypothetical protein
VLDRPDAEMKTLSKSYVMNSKMTKLCNPGAKQKILTAKKLFNDNEKILTNDFLLYLNGQCGSACPMS